MSRTFSPLNLRFATRLFFDLEKPSFFNKNQRTIASLTPNSSSTIQKSLEMQTVRNFNPSFKFTPKQYRILKSINKRKQIKEAEDLSVCKLGPMQTLMTASGRIVVTAITM
jgi:hypothetical protein